MQTFMSLNKTTRTLRRTAALLCAAFAGLNLAGPLRAQTPVADPNPSPAVPTPYSSPVFHAGGEFTPPPFAFPAPVPFPDPLYSQLQGTPTGLVPGTAANAGTTVSTEIPSFLLGNYNPALPPAAPGTYFPNHFRDDTIFSWSAPLTFLTPAALAPTPSPIGATLVPNVESTPTAVNVTEYPFIQNVQYVGTLPGSASTPDTTLPSGSTTIGGLHSGSAPTGSPYLIRQLVYFGRSENVVTTVGTVTTTTPVGAIYCVDGFTGEVVWRFQTPRVLDPVTGTYRDGSVFSTPAVAYINVLTNAGTNPPTYANKAVVVVGDNNGFVYCLDATGNGDGTSSLAATANGQPTYLAQPAYGVTPPPAITPAHVGTTPVYWIYRPDPAHPNTAAGDKTTNFDPNSNLPVPGPFGIASPNIYVENGVSTTPDANGALASNAVIYIGNTRDCVYALNGLGVANNRTGAALPSFNASLPPGVTGVSDAIPTANPRWWFTPDNADNLGTSFESTPALSPPTTPYPSATVITSSANPVQPGTPVTFTATVTGSVGQPTGSVTFTVGGVTQPPVTLAAGIATSAPVTLTAPGQTVVTATYSGDGNFTISGSTFNELVASGAAGSSNVVVTSSVNPSALGQSVTFTATVTDGGATPGPTPPTGTVTFSVDGVAQTPVTLPGTATGNTATFTTAALTTGTHTITATYSGDANFAPTNSVSASFQQIVFGPVGPTVYIGSSQELGVGSNAGRLYAIDGFNGPTYAATTGGGGRNLNQRAKWAFPNLYAGSGPTNIGGVGLRPALGDITGSPVVFTNTDDIVTPAVGTVGTPGYVPATYRTRIYFAANSGLEVPVTASGGTPATAPDPRPAPDATGRVWAVNTDGTTATTTEGGATTVWSFPQANDPNNPALDRTPEPSPPMGAFLDATPAMGFVQFPATIQYGAAGGYVNYTHADSVNADVKGKSVPMLYVGTNGSADLGFYALDVDGGNDTQRGIYRMESPTGSPFQSSPVLVVNSTTTGTTPGNGGAVYATAGNNLLQFTATPISNLNPAENFAFVGVDATFSGGGPISGPAVAAGDVADLTAAAFNIYGGKNTVDWVYFGDGLLGFCRGITPDDPSYGGYIAPGGYGGVTDTNPPQQFSNKFFLQAYLFDGTSNYPATSTDMTKSLPINNYITGFEWGGFAYVRIGNVVPPGFNPASPDTSLLVADPTDPTGTTFYGNGQAVNFSIGAATVTVPALTSSNAPNTATALTGAPGESVFVPRTDTLTPAQAAAQLQLVSPGTNAGWVAAYSYPIGSAQTRIGDTPGAYRRVREANQMATVYTAATAGGVTTYTASGTINLNTQTSAGSQYTTTTGNPPVPTIAQTPPAEQPTFGILNPLAVQGFGVPLPVAATSLTTGQAVADPDGAGPFGPITSQTSPTKLDLRAFCNGSNQLASLPKNGFNTATEDPTNTTQYLTEQLASAKVPIIVATAVDDRLDGTIGDIPDGTTGTNYLPVDGVYGLEAANRSLVDNVRTLNGSILFPSLPLAMQQVNAHWNDNTVAGSTVAGPGATVNPLPWEDMPSSVAANLSQDYPDIPASAITHTLVTASNQQTNLNNNGNVGNAFLDNASSTGTRAAVDHINVSITPPLHQPANLQVWDGTTKTPTTPGSMTVTDNIFPQGYIEGSGTGAGVSAGGGTPQRVFVDLGGQGRWSPVYPYREVQSFAGVPVNMKTSIQNGTISLGNAPSALGIQTEQSTLGLFDPYNPYYQPFFLPVTVYNEGNTNLLNVHFDQEMFNGTNNPSLYAVSDGNDPLSALAGFDYSGTAGPVNGGQRTTNAGAAIPLVPSSVPEQPFLYRTSVDTDLMQAYGRNPGIMTNSTLSAMYPGATFHKPRAGTTQPTTLTVPDVPTSGDAPFGLPTAAVPTAGSASLPYVGIALPFGTPFGSYHTLAAQPLRLFEGMDTPQANSQFYPPTYGGASGGHANPGSNLQNQLPLDANAQPLLPVSDPGVTLNIAAVENRLTDGFTFGALPMIDAAPAIPAAGTTAAQSTPDFAPAAFRDPASGSLSVYWTSGRSGSYGIYGANVPFNSGAATNNYFHPNDPTKNWYGSSLVGGLQAGTNSGLSITPGNGTNYAFAVNVSSTTPYSNTLYSYSVAPATGALSNAQSVTPPSDSSQVKYGVKGLLTSFSNPLWAFWTASTRGRTAIDYNSQASGGAWGATVTPLPIPAGLTAVADASPMLMTAPVNGALASTIEVTYSGTAPDGNVDLYVSRYLPGAGTAASTLSLVPFPNVTENLRSAPGGWYQSRDVAWSRTGVLNVTVAYTDASGKAQTAPLLYNGNVPQFTKAIYDKASGLLVLTGVHVPMINPPAAPALPYTINTVYVDAATGRIRFSPALSATTQNFAQIRATFSPLARRLTEDSRADTGPVTFLDDKLKANDDPTLANGTSPSATVEADRRWTIWRKSGISTDTGSATLYYKTQRLTVYLPSAVDTTKTLAIMLNGTAYNNGVDVENVPAVYNDTVPGQTPTVKYPASARLYFPISSGAEGAPFSVTYTPLGGGSTVTVPAAPATDTVEWQDYLNAADPNAVPFTNSIDALDAISSGYPVPMLKTTNENNVAAFLDPFAGQPNPSGQTNPNGTPLLNPHKVWLFWNSTRNGTEDIYSETIDPRFAPGP